MNLLIIKTGTTLPSLLENKGDFEDWILQGMAFPKTEALIVDVSSGDSLPGHQVFSGIVITGSHEMVTRQSDWSERSAEWIREIAERKIPTLGICYGHQLLAYALGGSVEDNLHGGEYGTVEVSLNPAAKTDALFKGLPTPIQVHVSHSQSVTQLPPGAKLLVSSRKDPHHAFVIHDCMWGIQFHPEFDAEITETYACHHREDMEKAGFEIDDIIRTCHDTPYGNRLLKRFRSIVESISAG